MWPNGNITLWLPLFHSRLVRDDQSIAKVWWGTWCFKHSTSWWSAFLFLCNQCFHNIHTQLLPITLYTSLSLHSDYFDVPVPSMSKTRSAFCTFTLIVWPVAEGIDHICSYLHKLAGMQGWHYSTFILHMIMPSGRVRRRNTIFDSKFLSLST